jgi:predicted outer membrane protein
MRRTGIAIATALAVLTAAPARAEESSGTAQRIASAHQTDFQLGQLATIRGGSARVRQFGQSLMDDHGAALERLAKGAAVEWPAAIDSKHRQLEEELSALEGREFDRKFIDAMVEDHEAMASLLRGQGGTSAAASPAPRSTGEGTAVGTSGAHAPAGTVSSDLKAVERHLAEARRLQKSLGGAR